jgi:microcystin-dependent protein
MPTNTVRSGYLRCNGATLNRTTYDILFNAINTIYGAGNGSTTFKIPDLRGRFIRGWGGASAAIGSPQEDTYQSHAHSWYWGTNAAYYNTFTADNYTTHNEFEWRFTHGGANHAGSETYPIYRTVVWGIKYI